MPIENILREFQPDDWVSLVNDNYADIGYKKGLVGIIFNVRRTQDGNLQCAVVFDELELQETVCSDLIISNTFDIELVWPGDEVPTEISQIAGNPTLIDTANIEQGAP